MYLATVDCATSTPSFSSSPWIRGAPHNVFSALIRLIRLCTSIETLGLPPRERDLHRQLRPETCSVPSHDRVRLDDDSSVQQRRHKAIEPDKKQSVPWREPWPGGKPAPQLMAQEDNLGLKPGPVLYRVDRLSAGTTGEERLDLD
jgi:hypothetical protein